MNVTEEASAPSPREPYWKPSARLQVQSVLYNNDPRHVARSAAALARAAELTVRQGACAHVMLRYGDSSPEPCLDKAALDALRLQHAATLSIEYDFFGANLGSAGGHNRLAASAEADFLLVKNPDVVVAPRALDALLDCFRRPSVGLAEAKQTPIEHPKDYDQFTGETSWASTACAMVSLPLFQRLGGFDAESFFLYCDDVDFSWMVRRAGYKVNLQPAAVCFHDKRLSPEGTWRPTSTERYYSAEGALFLAQKWSRQDLVEQHLAYFDSSGDEAMARAARVFRKRRAAGRIPAQIDPSHKIGVFDSGFYARQRYTL